MTAPKLPHSRVLAELADGLPQHVSHLARIAGVKPHQLNGFWQQMPAHIRGLLRQHDGQWRLVRPLALFNEEALQRLGAERGFPLGSEFVREPKTCVVAGVFVFGADVAEPDYQFDVHGCVSFFREPETFEQSLSLAHFFAMRPNLGICKSLCLKRGFQAACANASVARQRAAAVSGSKAECPAVVISSRASGNARFKS